MPDRVLTPIRVFLAEDHETVRQGFRLLLESQADITVVGEAADGQSAVSGIRARAPDVVILDVSMPAGNGLTVARQLRQLMPAVAIVALTRHDDAAYVREMLDAGATGYVLKQSTSTELLRAVRAAASGGRYLDATLRSQADDASPRKPRRTTISEREANVLRLMAIGHSNKEIADQLGISVKTVEVHKANAMRKLELRGRIDVVRYAVLRGWLADP